MIRPTATLLLALTLAACGGSDSGSPAASNADLAVTNAGDGEVNAGDTMTFVITVANDGPAAATNVAINHHLDGAPAIGTITCAATGGAACPAALGEAMTLDSFPAGGGLVFTVTVPGAPDRPGAVTSSMSATAAADQDTGNNRAEATTIALDLRNDTYTMFGSNGRQYTLVLDFNAMSYQVYGSGVNYEGDLVHDADGVGYLFNGPGTARFRTEADLVVGGFDFDASDQPYDMGVRPFVASRRFVADPATLVGRSFNLMGVNLRKSLAHPPESVVLPATFDSTTQLTLCQAPIPVRVADCPDQYKAVYALIRNGTTFVGTDAAHSDTIRFNVAQSGDALIFLRSEDAADNTGRHFRVGLAESAGLAGGSFVASSTRAAWGSTTLSDTHYAYDALTTAGTAINETADLTPLTAAAPTGMRRGARSTDGATIFFTQGGPLYLMLGERGGAADGQIDIGIH
ncbi:MAG: DUF11 domain-containing protein [Burkholderiaceae bacterium]